MKIYTTAPLEDPRDARTIYKKLEDIGYDGGFSFEAKHDPFLTLAVASEHTETLRLGTAIAIAFARNPMNLANLGYDMQFIFKVNELIPWNWGWNRIAGQYQVILPHPFGTADLSTLFD